MRPDVDVDGMGHVNVAAEHAADASPMTLLPFRVVVEQHRAPRGDGGTQWASIEGSTMRWRTRDTRSRNTREYGLTRHVRVVLRDGPARDERSRTLEKEGPIEPPSVKYSDAAVPMRGSSLVRSLDAQVLRSGSRSCTQRMRSANQAGFAQCSDLTRSDVRCRAPRCLHGQRRSGAARRRCRIPARSHAHRRPFPLPHVLYRASNCMEPYRRGAIVTIQIAGNDSRGEQSHASSQPPSARCPRGTKCSENTRSSWRRWCRTIGWISMADEQLKSSSGAIREMRALERTVPASSRVDEPKLARGSKCEFQLCATSAMLVEPRPPRR